MLTRSEITLALRPPRIQATPWVRPAPEGWRAAVTVRRDGRIAASRYSHTLATETAAYGLASAAAMRAEQAASDRVVSCRLALTASIVTPVVLGWLLAVCAL